MNRIVWVGGLPSHYTRGFQRRLCQEFGDAIRFVFLDCNEPRSSYECGDLPKGSTVLPRVRGVGSFSDLLVTLRRLLPAQLVVAGHYPRELGLLGLWAMSRGMAVHYWCDTNLLDVLRHSIGRRLLQRMVMRFYLRRTARMLFVGSRTREYYQWITRVHDDQRYAWLPYPHDPEPFESIASSIRARTSTFNVLYVGRLVRVKAVDRLVGAVQRARLAGRREVKLQIAGDGPERRRLERGVQEARLGDVVSFLGAVVSNAVPRVIRGADVVVLPSHREPWGLVINEALSSGKPVIAPSWVGAAGDILIDGQTGLVTNGNSPEELANALTRLAKDRDWCEELGQRGAALVRSGGWNVSGAIASFRALFVGAANSDVAVGL